MRKVLSSLIVLAILVGMFVCLGAQAFAAPEDIAVFAVADEQLSSEMIARLQEQCSGALLIDVNGFDEGQDQLGYNVVWVEQDPVVMAMSLMDASQVWPGFAIRQQVGPNNQPVIVVGVGEATTAEEVAAAITAAGADGTEFTVAVGPAAASEAVKNQVKLFLVSGETDGAISDLEGTKAVHVARADAPVAAVFIGADGTITSADNMPLPQAADPNVGPVEPEVADPNVGPTEPEQNTEPEPTEVPLYDVVYKGNGGGGIMQDDFDFQSDLDYYFKQNGYTAPEGQEFAGWMIEGDETATVYQPNDAIHVDRDIVVLAQWKDIAPADPAADGSNGPGVGLGAGPVTSVVTISFDANGGTGTMDPQTVAAGVDNPVPECTFTAPEGMKFDHWLGSDWVDYYVGEPINVQTDVTLAAQWVENAESAPAQTFTITYQPGEAAGCQEVQNTWEQGMQIGLSKPADWSYEGHSLTGWTKDGVSYGVDELYDVTGDATFTATWSADAAVVNATVTYMPGEHGTGDAVSETVENIGAGVDYTVQGTCPFEPADGYSFIGWAVEGDTSGKVYMPSMSDSAAGQYRLTGNVTFVAQWQETVQQPATWTVNFHSGADNSEGTMDPATVEQGKKLTLPECTYTVPGLTFAGWNVGDPADPAAAGTEIDVSGNMDIFATWKQDVVTFTITYKANGGAGEDTTDTAEENKQITLPTASFTAPAGQEFDYWTIENGDGTKFPAGSTYTVTADVTFVANWKEKTSQDPGATTTDMLMYTQGGTDEPSLSFTNAQIATVSFDNYALTNGTQFALSDDNKTVTFNNEFLDTQSVGQHNIAVTFQNGSDGTTYASATRTMEIKAPPSVTPETNPDTRTIQQDWLRSGSWTHTFDKAPTLVQIYYGTSGGQAIYQTAKSGTDYTVSGNSLTLLPALVNGNWGGQWPNATYSFRVTLNNDPNDVYTLQLKLTGEAPATTATPVPTQTPANNANVPVTGDETPLMLYIVILVVLIAVLATVLIIVIKRRNSGSRGRH